MPHAIVSAQLTGIYCSAQLSTRFLATHYCQHAFVLHANDRLPPMSADSQLLVHVHNRKGLKPSCYQLSLICEVV